MDENVIISAIDDEIRRLQQVRALLSGVKTPAAATQEPKSAKKAVRRRRLSRAARKRIAAAQKKRWTTARAKDETATPAKSEK